MIQICLISRTAQQKHKREKSCCMCHLLQSLTTQLLKDYTFLILYIPFAIIKKINKNRWEPLESRVCKDEERERGRERNLVEITNLHSRLVCHFQQMTFHFQQMTVILYLYFSIAVLPCGVYQESRGGGGPRATHSWDIYQEEHKQTKKNFKYEDPHNSVPVVVTFPPFVEGLVQLSVTVALSACCLCNISKNKPVLHAVL